jgi:hypothetical protein
MGDYEKAEETIEGQTQLDINEDGQLQSEINEENELVFEDELQA